MHRVASKINITRNIKNPTNAPDYASKERKWARCTRHGPQQYTQKSKATKIIQQKEGYKRVLENTAVHLGKVRFRPWLRPRNFTRKIWYNAGLVFRACFRQRLIMHLFVSNMMRGLRRRRYEKSIDRAYGAIR
jgi:hypothetical protein